MFAGNQTLATLPLHPLKAVPAGGWWRRLIDTIRLWFASDGPLPICYLNGDYLPLSEARVSPLDRAFLFGDAVYEVVPVYGGAPVSPARASGPAESQPRRHPHGGAAVARRMGRTCARN